MLHLTEYLLTSFTHIIRSFLRVFKDRGQIHRFPLFTFLYLVFIIITNQNKKYWGTPPPRLCKQSYCAVIKFVTHCQQDWAVIILGISHTHHGYWLLSYWSSLCSKSLTLACITAQACIDEELVGRGGTEEWDWQRSIGAPSLFLYLNLLRGLLYSNMNSLGFETIFKCYPKSTFSLV